MSPPLLLLLHYSNYCALLPSSGVYQSKYPEEGQREQQLKCWANNNKDKDISPTTDPRDSERN